MLVQGISEALLICCKLPLVTPKNPWEQQQVPSKLQNALNHSSTLLWFTLTVQEDKGQASALIGASHQRPERVSYQKFVRVSHLDNGQAEPDMGECDLHLLHGRVPLVEPLAGIPLKALFVQDPIPILIIIIIIMLQRDSVINCLAEMYLFAQQCLTDLHRKRTSSLV